MAFRRLIKELNPGALGLVVTEFISVEALTRRVPRSLAMMRYAEMERPFCVQIFGHDVQRMRDAALMAQDAGADVVDINSGCPAPKVVRKGGGCELMRQPLHLGKIVEAVRSVLSVPLTLKMRAGWDCHSVNCVEIARICEQSGVDGLAVHGRTRTQMYRGDADWDLVWQVKRAVSVPVLGSGDIVGLESLTSKVLPKSEGDCVASSDAAVQPSGVELSGVQLSGALIGRCAMQNPLVFSDITFGKQEPLRQNEARCVAILDRYSELLQEELEPKASIGKIKQLASQMLRGVPWRKSLLLAPTFAAQLEILRALKAGTFSVRPSDISNDAFREGELTSEEFASSEHL
jgi:tRNA-dihydrouridine synthase